jgi:signal transduction histidine kinase
VFALVPAAVLTLAWGTTLWRAAPLVTGAGAWERVATSGGDAIAAARSASLTEAQRAAVDAHERELRSSLEQARRYNYLAARSAGVVAVAALFALALLAVIASRVAGHLSRQLSRPLNEIVEWTDRIARGERLPDTPPRRGAPEFETLRTHMRWMAGELEEGRRQALDAERLRAFRESARQVAHELKNPLTPIRLATEKVAASATPELFEAVDVLRTETERLARMARSFSQFGRLPEGIAADLDVAELVRYSANATVPPEVQLDITEEPALPPVRGHHDALAGAISNVLLNAVEACDGVAGGRISIAVSRTSVHDRAAVRIVVSDTGCGIPDTKLGHIWEPYITDKPGGTGLGLAIARQAVLAHGGEVAASSTPGRGTTIELVIPASPPVSN